MFERFSTSRKIDVGNDVFINARVGGQGRPLLLLHGHPQTHVMWHRVADQLAERFTVVAADLRGYGDSSRVPAGTDSGAYAKRVMARDMVALMSALGFDRFQLGSHDRGSRVAHRLALDHPDKVERLMTLDIAPTLAMYEGTTEQFARAYWHWFFLIAPSPLPERLIDASPVAYIRDLMGGRHAGLSAFDPAAMAEYERCVAIPGTAESVCSDYRASAGIDLVHDRADRESGHHLTLPHRVLWGGKGVVGKCFDVMALWNAVSKNATGREVDSGHYIAEEQPGELLQEMLEFFVP